MNIDAIIRRLRALGWALRANITLSGVVREYQRWHGLDETGDLDVETLASLAAVRFCGLPDRPSEAEPQGKLCRWQDKHITWTWTGGDDLGVPQDQVTRCAEIAWQRWVDVCGIVAERVDDASKADVVMGAGIGREAGPSGTLAWSELPCSPTDRQLQQRYDTEERWVIAETGTPHNGIDLVRVMCHEIGHAIGLPHQPAGNLMAPMYSAQVWQPQAYESSIVSQRRMYGPPVQRPKPGADQPEPPKDLPLPEITVSWQGKTGRIVWE